MFISFSFLFYIYIHVTLFVTLKLVNNFNSEKIVHSPLSCCECSTAMGSSSPLVSDGKYKKYITQTSYSLFLPVNVTRKIVGHNVWSYQTY